MAKYHLYSGLVAVHLHIMKQIRFVSIVKHFFKAKYDRG